MPIYEYHCCNCEKVTEKISSRAMIDIECPDCGSKADRIVSVFSGKTDSPSGATNSCHPGSGFN